jgi:PPOX class probable FMN-dependent enzyme
MTRITDLSALEALYGTPAQASVDKEIPFLTPEYRAFIEAAPFVVIATVSDDGTDCSPRGDPPGFVVVEDDRTLLIPDRRGNNRLDTLRNLVRDPRCSLLFLVPGAGETIRVNGRASIIADDALNARFEMQGKMPATVLRIHIDSVYFQCQKALVRSRIWHQESQIERSELPSAGQMVKAVKSGFDADGYDAEYPERMKRTIY